jgi:hypothetical protein
MIKNKPLSAVTSRVFTPLLKKQRFSELVHLDGVLVRGIDLPKFTVTEVYVNHAARKMRQGLKVGSLLIFLLVAVGVLGFYTGQPSLSFTVNPGEFEASRPLFDMPSDSTQPWIEQVSWAPRIFVYHNILSQEECEEIINIGSTHLTESKVVAASGQCKYLCNFAY